MEMAHIENGNTEVVRAVFDFKIVLQGAHQNVAHLIVDAKGEETGHGNGDEQAADRQIRDPSGTRMQPYWPNHISALPDQSGACS
jgi:hypothetical protein